MSKRIVRNIFENVKDENIALTSEISSKLSYKDLKLFINKIYAIYVPTYKSKFAHILTLLCIIYVQNKVFCSNLKHFMKFLRIFLFF